MHSGTWRKSRPDEISVWEVRRLAEKEKERRKNNKKEATVVVKGRGVHLVPEEPQPEGEASQTQTSENEDSKPQDSESQIEECRLAKSSLDDVRSDQRIMESRYLQVLRKAKSVRVIDPAGQTEMRENQWTVPRDAGMEILGELTALRAALDDTDEKMDTYALKISEACR